MRVWRNFSDIAAPVPARGAVLALGNFDGLHRGHRVVLEKAKLMAKELNAPLAVMTFEPNPRRLFNPSLPILRIVSLAERLRLLKRVGVEHVFLQHFTHAFSRTPAEEFIEHLLIRDLGVSGVVTGADFRFGHQRSGNSELLALYASKNKFRYEPVTVLESEGMAFSSTRIREALAAGKPEMAALLLGRPYSLTGNVVTGDQRGREWGFPTANVRPGRIFLPAYGIYATRVHADSEVYDAVSSFGIRPMYKVETPLLETHVLDASPMLYGKKLRVELLHYLRPEEKFPDEAALRAQIARDCEEARRLLAKV